MNPFSRTDQSARLPTSGWVLVAVNLIPLFGVFFGGWKVYNIVLLYWLETAVIGAINVLRILTASGDPKEIAPRLLAQRGIVEGSEQWEEVQAQLAKLPAGMKGAMHGIKLFMVPFFCVHFGMFMAVHLVFIVALLGGGMSGRGPSPFDGLSALGDEVGPLLIGATLSLFVSHLYSFFANYLGRGEYLRTTPPEQMMRPYGRVVVMHLAILFGAFVALVLGNGVAILLLLVAGKIVIDLKFHLRERRKAEEGVGGPVIFG